VTIWIAPPPAVKELVQDANFDCNEGGIVSNRVLLFCGFELICDMIPEPASDG
jgi:hypothetical protein